MRPSVRKTEAPLPTLEDVAQSAGVSTATVSRCLNSPERVQEETRNRVLTAVRDLGYAPNFGARALAAKRTNTVGAIIPTMENAIFARGLQAFQEELGRHGVTLLVAAIFARGLQAFQEELGRHGVTLLVASSSYRQDLEEEQIRTLITRGADGLLLIGHDRTPDIYDFLDRRGVPYVIAWVFNASEPRLSIGFDNRAAMRALAQVVIAQGHRQIGVISAEQKSNDRARERVEGIHDAMRESKLDPDRLRVIETTYSIDNGARGFETLMAGEPQPTAIMCGNDVLAVGALKRAQQIGLAVPRDVSITGFDDIEIAQIATPELTTVHVPHRAMGRGAAEMLVAMLEGDGPDRSIRLDADVRLRGTLGAPRQSPSSRLFAKPEEAP